jgi:uncharacterized membrane protein
VATTTWVVLASARRTSSSIIPSQFSFVHVVARVYGLGFLVPIFSFVFILLCLVVDVRAYLV